MPQRPTQAELNESIRRHVEQSAETVRTMPARDRTIVSPFAPLPDGTPLTTGQQEAIRAHSPQTNPPQGNPPETPVMYALIQVIGTLNDSGIYPSEMYVKPALHSSLAQELNMAADGAIRSMVLMVRGRRVTIHRVVGSLGEGYWSNEMLSRQGGIGPTYGLRVPTLWADDPEVGPQQQEQNPSQRADPGWWGSNILPPDNTPLTAERLNEYVSRFEADYRQAQSSADQAAGLRFQPPGQSVMVSHVDHDARSITLVDAPSPAMRITGVGEDRGS